MGNDRPIKTSIFVAFLMFKGCKRLRTKASHDHYKCPCCFRTITIREKDKEIPPLHIHNNLKTMGVSRQEFLDWVKENY